MKMKVYCGLQNESGGTQWKLQLRLPRFRLPAIAAPSARRN